MCRTPPPRRFGDVSVVGSANLDWASSRMVNYMKSSLTKVFEGSVVYQYQQCTLNSIRGFAEADQERAALLKEVLAEPYKKGHNVTALNPYIMFLEKHSPYIVKSFSLARPLHVNGGVLSDKASSSKSMGSAFLLVPLIV